MNVEEMTFGVEIETTIPAGRLSVGPHGNGCAIPELPGWKADRDPSIRATRGREACEFVSPVYTGSAGLAQLLADLAAVKSFGATVNDSCGLHIHVSFNKADAAQLAKLVTLVANFEKAIYATTGTKKREQGRWCNSLQRYGDVASAERRVQGDRYHVCNIATAKPTVEFRAFGATLDPVKLSAYVRMCVGLVERALRATKTTDWKAKPVKDTSPIHRSGEGQTAVTRLFYQLGWTKGRQPHVHGDFAGQNVPDLHKAKKELMRLAQKYDTPESERPRRDGLAVGMWVTCQNGRLAEIVGFATSGIGRVVIRFPGETRTWRAIARTLTPAPTAPTVNATPPEAS